MWKKRVIYEIIMVLLQLGKEITPDAISDITSSSPEISGSGDSSLSNGHSSLSDIINDWRRELEEKNTELRHKIAITNSLEERLQEKDLELCETRNECKAAQIERDKNCLMVGDSIFITNILQRKSILSFMQRRCRHAISYAIFKIIFCSLFLMQFFLISSLSHTYTHRFIN